MPRFRYFRFSSAAVARPRFSWSEIWSQVRKVARVLVATGLEPGDRVCIDAATSLEWVIAELAVMAAGGVSVPIYPTVPADECAWIAEHCGATVVLCGTAEQTLRFVDIRKAYDTAWREGLLVKLWAKGVRGHVWVLCNALLHRTSARARCAERAVGRGSWC